MIDQFSQIKFKILQFISILNKKIPYKVWEAFFIFDKNVRKNEKTQLYYVKYNEQSVEVEAKAKKQRQINYLAIVVDSKHQNQNESTWLPQIRQENILFVSSKIDMLAIMMISYILNVHALISCLLQNIPCGQINNNK